MIYGQGLEAVVVEPSSSSALAQAGEEECQARGDQGKGCMGMVGEEK